MENKKFCKFCGQEIDANSIVCPKCGRQLKTVKKTEESNNSTTQQEEKPNFYTQDWFMWIMLLLFPPVGIFLMWKFNEKMKKNTKIILSFIFGILFLISMVSGEDSSIVNEGISSSNNSSMSDEVEKTKVQIIDFSSMKEHEILTWCNNNNLSCKFEREYSDSIAKDMFIKQSINANDKVEENTKITITFSLGKEPTIGQKNALRSAKNYLDVMAFSYSGLIKQLEFEKYSHSDAVYAADNCGANWNEQAVKSAKNYLDVMSFSRDGLIDQLKFEGFTHEQAVYGVEQNGL